MNECPPTPPVSSWTGRQDKSDNPTASGLHGQKPSCPARQTRESSKHLLDRKRPSFHQQTCIALGCGHCRFSGIPLTGQGSPVLVPSSPFFLACAIGCFNSGGYSSYDFCHSVRAGKGPFPDAGAVRSECHYKENTETRPVQLPTNY